MSMPGAKIRCPSLSRRKLVLRAIAGAVGGAGEVTDQRAGNPRIEHHRHPPRRDFARIEPLDRALAGGAADVCRRVRGRRRAAPRRNRNPAPCRCRCRRSPTSRPNAASRWSAPGKPWLVTSTMPPMPAEAEAPPDLLTPATPSPAASARRARASSTSTPGMSGSSRSRSGKLLAEQRRIGKPGELVLGRGARHGDGALRQRIEAVALRSLVETAACFRPTRTRKPTSSPSERCDSSTAPSRTSTDSEIERTATASA